MLIDKRCKIENVCSMDGYRENLAHPYLVIDKRRKAKGQLVATDGRTLVSLEVDLGEGDTPGPVNVDAFDVARKAYEKSPVAVVPINVNGDVEIPNASYKAKRVTIEKDYPDWRTVLEDATRDKAVFKIGLSVKLLQNILEACGGDMRKKSRQTTVYLTFRGEGKPIEVEVPSGVKARALLMPILDKR